MSRALVIGEALIDIVQRDRTVSTERGHERASSTEHVGGSPLNVAVGLARLGRDVDFLTHIADDEHGRRIVEYVKTAGVQLVSDSVTAKRTPTAQAVLAADGSAQYTFDIDWQLSGTPEVAPPLVVHTGSIASVLEPGCRAVAALLDAYHVSATVTFDPNVRTALITDEDAARGRIERLVERADVVKASDEDLRWLDPRRTPEQIAQTWLGMGPAVVAVTMGERGAFAVSAAGIVRVPARPVQVVDTVGAGDAFMTGLIDALWSHGLLGADRRAQLARISAETLEDVVQTAGLSSTLTVARAGADLPDLATRNAAVAGEPPAQG
ncbi:carbohydrate kinase [Mycobacterium sp. 21AC1]|uniref:carbohydrate kinase family protein n=1 Tax=[Mycobacterium] appelbergii TaxID=2939269 RepID=UPI002939175A|nr:carbohydrate kinase [Mycobacterium sp. 21AC1]MDV3130240.1 carbohydrate kinase [Mycobacterium sp. 21AC1]